MLAEDLELIDIDGRHWNGWLDLLVPPTIHRDASWAAVFVEGKTVVKAVLAGQGAVIPADVPFTGTSQQALADLRDKLEVGAVIVMEVDALPRLFAAFESELSIEDDYVAQGLVMWRALKRLSGRGIWSEPRALDILPNLSADALQKTFDLLVPNRTCIAAYVFADDRKSIDASIIAVKEHGDIALATTHLGISDLLSERNFARDWRSQYKRALQAIDDRFAQPSIGVFIERGAVNRIITGPPDQLSRELNASNLIVEPAPTWLVGLLGGARAAAAATRGARALAKFVPKRARVAATTLARSAQDRMRESGAHPFALLGFDPLELWRQVRHYYRQGG